MAFGQHRDRTLSAAEQQVRYRQEERRQNARFEWEQFCKAQNARIAKSLKASADRVNTARWGSTTDGDGLFVITKSGRTEVSKPVRRDYQEQ